MTLLSLLDLLYELCFACKSQLVSVTVQVVHCCGTTDVRLLLATNNGRERMHGSSNKVNENKTINKTLACKAWQPLQHSMGTKQECQSKSERVTASAAPLAWVMQ